ncbi:conserved domain protein, partial [Mycoplasmopsis alligatoris A21JP2]
YVRGRSIGSGSSSPEYQKSPLRYYVNGQPTGADLSSRIDHDSFFANLSDRTLKRLSTNFGSEFGAGLVMATYLGGNNGFRFPTASGMEAYIDEKTRYMANVNLDIAFEKSLVADDLPQYLEELGIKKPLSPLHMYGKKLIGNNQNTSLWLVNDKENKLVKTITNRDETLLDYANASYMKINESVLDNSVDKSLFSSYFYKEKDKLYGSEIIFNDIQKWFDFVSLDFSKVTIDKKNKKINWNIDYVQSKFNIDRFARALKQALTKPSALSQSKKDHLNNLVKNDNLQELANEIIWRFMNSKLNAFSKSFSLSDIKTNSNLAWIFDKDLGLNKYKTPNFTIFEPDASKYEVGIKHLLNVIEKYAKDNNAIEANLTLFDYLVFNNQITVQTDQMLAAMLNNRTSLIPLITTFINGNFKKIVPSADALGYFDAKNERKFNEFFTDYTYSFAEVINRDNLQITYSPSNAEFGNMPSYISNITEATTGLEYVVDAEKTKKWKDLVISFDDHRNPYNSLKGTVNLYTSTLNNERKNIARNLGLKFENSTLSDAQDFTDTQTFNSSYFGKVQTINNGWFKDRWYREILGFSLYDDYGKPVIDESIRIKNLEGKKVNNRPEAYWQYYIQSQGVGLRSLSGIWRDRDKDAVAFYGYIPAHLANKANFLAFKDTKTGKVVTLPINKENSNNMFYYKEQKVNNEKESATNKNVRHYLKDEKYTWTDSQGNKTSGTGFVSYASNYAIVSKYANALLLPGNEYEIYFAQDQNGTFATEIYLGKTESVSENGKTYSQAPTSVRNENGKLILRVQDQFNIF